MNLHSVCTAVCAVSFKSVEGLAADEPKLTLNKTARTEM